MTLVHGTDFALRTLMFLDRFTPAGIPPQVTVQKLEAFDPSI